MQFTKMNLLQKFNEKMPIGLSSLGLKKGIQKEKKNKTYPRFFRFDKIKPIAN